MRLLRRLGPLSYVFTENFDDESEIPPYAILSHTWGAEEVTFQDFVRGDSKDKVGYEKIRFCGEQASKDGLQHFWIDTCCINKTNFAELSQSIQKMFRWYEAADRCYVYMTDVHTSSDMCVEKNHRWDTEFRNSRWFTRGWTLQELLAPSSVDFYSNQGHFLGNRNSLVQQVHEITAIPHAALQGESLHLFSVEDRLRWKGNRKTTLPEDAAYSIAGLFSVSLAPVYGEGAELAYRRLNDEIRDMEECIRALRDTDPRDDQKRIEDTKGGLLEDSYRWILDNVSFQQWQTDSSKPLLWIKGDPGKGKTMLLCGIVNELKKAGNNFLVSSFFCQATDTRINSGKAMLRGLLYLLVEQHPRLVYHIRKKYDGVKDRSMFEDTNAWTILKEMVTQVLQDPMLPTTYLIVDALDECTTELPKLLEFISEQVFANLRVKWLISSRNWPEIEQYLGQADHQVRLSLELNSEFVATAVNHYIQQKVMSLSSFKKLDDGTRDAVLKHLLSKADSTFLWVSLVCQALQDTSKRNIRKKLESFPPGLAALYEQMMHHIRQSDDAEMCTNILAMSTLVYRPLTVDELSALVEDLDEDDPNTTRELIGLCGSFLTLRDGIIYFVHQSAKDFLLKQPIEELFPAGTREIHRSISARSLRLMSRDLHRDMFCLGAPSHHFVPDRHVIPIPDPLAASRYSCIYWAEHLYESSQITSAFSSTIESFLSHTYLYWLEALALCGHLRKSIISFGKLGSLIEFCQEGISTEVGPAEPTTLPDAWSRIYALIQDASRFIMYHLTACEAFPLQLYASALVFSPSTSLTRQNFQHEHNGSYSVKTPLSSHWSACLATVENYGSIIALSPGLDLLAVAKAGEVRVLDTNSYANVWTLQDADVRAITFSSQSNLLVTASGTGCIKIWDPSDGACIVTFSEGAAHENLNFIVFNDSLIASASATSTSWLCDDHLIERPPGTIKVWDITDKPVLTMMVDAGDDNDFYSVAFSPDSKRLASGSKRSIQIWDISSGTCQKLLGENTHSNECVVFAPDASVLASVSLEGVKIWDVDKGTCLMTFPDQISRRKSIAFSPDSKLLASISTGGTVINIWNVDDGTCLQSLNDRTGYTTSVAFSHATRLVTASAQDTVKIWDVTFDNSKVSEEANYRTDKIKTMVFSYDSAWLATSSPDYGIEIWKTEDGKCLATLNLPRDDAYEMTYLSWISPTQLAVGLEEDHVSIWDITGSGISCSQRLHLQMQSLTKMAISHDCTMLAASSKQWNKQGTQEICLELYDLARGLRIHVLHLQYDITYLLFSLDDAWLYSSLGTLSTSSPYDFVDEYISRPTSPVVEPSQALELVGEGTETWIRYEGKNILWIPEDFRPAAGPGYPYWLVSPNRRIMAIFTEDLRLWFLEFDPSKRPKSA